MVTIFKSKERNSFYCEINNKETFQRLLDIYNNNLENFDIYFTFLSSGMCRIVKKNNELKKSHKITTREISLKNFLRKLLGKEININCAKIKMNNIGLTGSTGSLGKTLLKNKTEFKIFCFKGDIRNRYQIQKWLNKNDINIIIHLAAIVPIINVNKNRKKAYEVNYLGTKNLVDLSIHKKIKWFFFSSTSHVYQSSKNKILETNKKKPISFYGKTKYKAENYIIKKFKKRKYSILYWKNF